MNYIGKWNDGVDSRRVVAAVDKAAAGREKKRSGTAVRILSGVVVLAAVVVMLCSLAARGDHGLKVKRQELLARAADSMEESNRLVDIYWGVIFEAEKHEAFSKERERLKKRAKELGSKSDALARESYLLQVEAAGLAALMEQRISEDSPEAREIVLRAEIDELERIVLGNPPYRVNDIAIDLRDRWDDRIIELGRLVEFKSEEP